MTSPVEKDKGLEAAIDMIASAYAPAVDRKAPYAKFMAEKAARDAITAYLSHQEPTDAQIEAAAKAYADATGYYVEFHRGLSSPSADKIRAGMRAALLASYTVR